jgi:hypothetical protein
MAGEIAIGVVLQLFAVQLAIFEALLFAASAAHKALRWQQAEIVVRQFAGVPPRLSAAALGWAIAIEMSAALLLIAPRGRVIGAGLAALIWASYLALIIRAIRQKRRDVDCGCSFGASSRPLGAFQLGRNTVLAGFALLIGGVSVMSGGVPAQEPRVLGSLALGGLALLALYGALDQVMSLRPLRRGEVL